MEPVPVAAADSAHALSAGEVLAAMDGGASELQQAMALVGAAFGLADPGHLTLGELDRALLALHLAVLGTGIELVGTCAACGARSSFPIAADTLPEPSAHSAWQGPGAGLREPRLDDLAGLPPDPEIAARVLAGRCAIGPDPDPRDVDLLERVDTALQGTVAGACVECGERVSAELDVASHVLHAFAAVCEAYDAEVHVLAIRYGWSLEEIDALPESRRRRLVQYAGGLS